jgi:hypothetical protein
VVNRYPDPEVDYDQMYDQMKDEWLLYD